MLIGAQANQWAEDEVKRMGSDSDSRTYHVLVFPAGVSARSGDQSRQVVPGWYCVVAADAGTGDGQMLLHSEACGAVTPEEHLVRTAVRSAVTEIRSASTGPASGPPVLGPDFMSKLRGPDDHPAGRVEILPSL